MEYRNLRGQPIEDLLNRVQGLTAAAAKDEVQSIMAIVARCTLEIGDTLTKLSGDIQEAQRILGGRLSGLTDQLQQTRSEMATASEAASKHTAALVMWTRVLAVLTGIYAFLTGGMLLVALFGSPWSAANPPSSPELKPPAPKASTGSIK
jgi:hypothetical protein